MNDNRLTKLPLFLLFSKIHHLMPDPLLSVPPKNTYSFILNCSGKDKHTHWIKNRAQKRFTESLLVQCTDELFALNKLGFCKHSKQEMEVKIRITQI